MRIAILDTGIDRDHDYINAREANVKGRHNCYGDSQRSVVDRNGHGTFAANLILDYAPDAELYIIKIADGNVRPEARLVAEVSCSANTYFLDLRILTLTGNQPRA